MFQHIEKHVKIKIKQTVYQQKAGIGLKIRAMYYHIGGKGILTRREPAQLAVKYHQQNKPQHENRQGKPRQYKKSYQIIRKTVFILCRYYTQPHPEQYHQYYRRDRQLDSSWQIGFYGGSYRHIRAFAVPQIPFYSPFKPAEILYGHRIVKAVFFYYLFQRIHLARVLYI